MVKSDYKKPIHYAWIEFLIQTIIQLFKNDYVKFQRVNVDHFVQMKSPLELCNFKIISKTYTIIGNL